MKLEFQKVNAALPLSGPCPGRRRRWRHQPGHWTPMSLACMGLRPRKLRATGQRRIGRKEKEEHR